MSTTLPTLQSPAGPTSQGSSQAMLKSVSPDPPRRFEPGTILTLRMRGHSRSPVAGQDYFAPAVVLDQFMPGGEISVLIWDSSAGTHYNGAYAIRELGVRGQGAEREMYELQSNVGEVLFSPEAFAAAVASTGQLHEAVYVINEQSKRNHDDIVLVSNELGRVGRDHDARLASFEAFMNEFRQPAPSGTGASGDLSAQHADGAPQHATKDDTQKPKASK